MVAPRLPEKTEEVELNAKWNFVSAYDEKFVAEILKL